MAEVDIVQIVENNPITKLSSSYQSKLLLKLKEQFNQNDQQMFLASFYCYLNYNPRTDFVVDLDKIWKWLGFSQKARARELLVKHFTLNTEYKIERETSDFLGKETHPNGGGLTFIDKITMTVRTFKSLCLKAKYKKSQGNT
jgi:hypothetical protein